MCCISLACHMHRDTTRKFGQCLVKLQRGTCAKNTVRFLKNDPNLTCPHCTVQTVQHTAPTLLEDSSRSNTEQSTAAAHDHSDDSWSDDEAVQSIQHSKVQLVSTAMSCRQASAEFALEPFGHLQFGNDDLQELSHEEGIQLIDEMYGAEEPDYSIEDMDTSDDETYSIPEERHYDLDQVRSVSIEVMEIIQSNYKHDIASNTTRTPQHCWPTTPTSDNDTIHIDIHTNLLEAEELLQQARQEIYQFRNSWPEMQSEFHMCSEKYGLPVQILVDSDGRL